MFKREVSRVCQRRLSAFEMWRGKPNSNRKYYPKVVGILEITKVIRNDRVQKQRLARSSPWPWSYISLECFNLRRKQERGWTGMGGKEVRNVRLLWRRPLSPGRDLTMSYSHMHVRATADPCLSTTASPLGDSRVSSTPSPLTLEPSYFIFDQ